eukprot:Clim_evm26s164 gene=Clim_evmTU26s164
MSKKKRNKSAASQPGTSSSMEEAIGLGRLPGLWIFVYYVPSLLQIYRIYKWFYRLFTGTGELQRLLKKGELTSFSNKEELPLGRDAVQFAHILTTMELSIIFSTQLLDVTETGRLLQADMEPSEVAEAVGRSKLMHTAERTRLAEWLEVTRWLSSDIHYANTVRRTMVHPESKRDLHDLTMVYQLHTGNEDKPDIPSKIWDKVGFQGEDPCTDFRGMGRLALEQLVYIGEVHTDRARSILSGSHHPIHWYSYAITGINLTGVVFRMLTEGSHPPLRPYIYAILAYRKQPKGTDRLWAIHEAYTDMFESFHEYWMAKKPPTVMHFSGVLEAYTRTVRTQLNAGQFHTLRIPPQTPYIDPHLR